MVKNDVLKRLALKLLEMSTVMNVHSSPLYCQVSSDTLAIVRGGLNSILEYHFTISGIRSYKKRARDCGLWIIFIRDDSSSGILNELDQFQ